MFFVRHIPQSPYDQRPIITLYSIDMNTASNLDKNLKKTLSKGRIALTRPLGCPDIKLHLFDPCVLTGPLSHDDTQAVIAAPAYWSFCWASGQVLAQYILDNPRQVANKVVVDVGSGSGVVAIAAALAGAKKVYACDSDDDALHAAKINAQENNVELLFADNLDKIKEPIDIITAADLLYDKDNLPLLKKFSTIAKHVLLADSRIKTLPTNHYQLECTVEARTWPDLNEFEEFNQVRIYVAGSNKK